MAASVSFLILVVALRIPLSNGDPRFDIVARSCKTGQVQDSKKYFKDYADILDKMQYDMYREKLALREKGTAPDRINDMSQCIDDLSKVESALCFAQISNLLPSCFPSTGGRVYLDGCFIRGENHSFYLEIIANGDVKRCSNDVDTSVGFQKALSEVMKKVVSKAPTNGGFDFSPDIENGSLVCGMAQCWKTLDSKMCTECLTDAANSALSCLPAVEGRALNAGCFLRHSNYEFSNDSFPIMTRAMF